MDINDLANTDNLALAKYYVSPRDWQAFCAGALNAAAAGMAPPPACCACCAGCG